MWLIAGLGNPGHRYQGTRHNVGFWVVDELAHRHISGIHCTKFGGESWSGSIKQTNVLLLKPMEFMNNSGFALQRAAQFYKVPVHQIIVIHDELDLPPSRLRLKSGGGHGGNNGLRSIIAQLGTNEFHRIRIGIGKPDHSNLESAKPSGADYVLSPFLATEKDSIDEAIARAADATEAILASGITAAMNNFNGVSPS